MSDLSNNHKFSAINYSLILIVFWLFVGSATFLQDITIKLAEGREINWDWSIIGPIHWFIWILLTPFVIKLVRKIPFSWSDPKSVFPKAFGLIVGFSIVHMALLLCFVNLYWITFVGEWLPTNAVYWFLCSNTFTTNFLVLSVIIGITMAIENHQLHRNLEYKSAQLESQLVKAKITALKTQLHPHFLFNTLNSINTLILKKDNDNAEKMLNRLSLLLRETLDSENEQWISLQEELRISRLFLDIYQLRFSDRLNVQFDLDESAMECKVPNFLLQPIVENAMVHGISKLTGQGILKIKTNLDSGQLTVEVWDNGPGIQSDSVVEGLGLKNTRERISEMYQNVDLVYGNAPDHGFLVQLKFPCNAGVC